MIYLDYAANCPVDKKVLEDFNLNSILYYANPNSTHRLGLEAKEKIDEATSYIANVFKCKNENVIYTSGSSESNNLVIKGFAAKYKNAHIITTSIEHSSIIAPVNYLLNKGVSVDILEVNDEGKIDIEELENLIDDRTTLVSITSVESETGIPVTIPEFGETYDVKEQIEMTHKIERKVSKTIKSEIIERLEKLKSEMNDMDQYVRQDVNNENLRDEDIFRINEKIKDLEKQILNVIEG